jgi:hypothetical protein
VTGRSLVATAALALLLVAGAVAARPAPDNPDLWAVVTVDGTLVRSNHAISSRQLGADGSYEVIFDRDVTGCAYVASGENDDGLTLGVAPRDTNPAGVYVIEYDAVLARDSYSSGFHLIVSC